MELIPAETLKLKIGGRLEHAIVDRNGQVLLQKGKVVSTDAILARLNERGFYLKETPAAVGLLLEDAPEDALQQEKTTHGKLAFLADRLAGILSEVGGAPGPKVAGDLFSLLGWINDLFVRDQDQFVGAQQLLSETHSLAERAIHNATITKMLCVAAGVPVQQHLSLMAAALTLDVAVFAEHDELSRHTGALTLDQRKMIQNHPKDSAELLAASGIDDTLWLLSVAQHHERLDGCGYPKGLKGEEITVGSRIVAIADTYTGMLRPRGDRAPFIPPDALKDIFAKQAEKLDSRLAQLLIKQLGLYPPGTVVKLGSGEIAVCTRRTSDARFPVLRAAIGVDGAVYASPKPRDPRSSEGRIVEIIPASRAKGLRPLVAALWRKDMDLGG